MQGSARRASHRARPLGVLLLALAAQPAPAMSSGRAVASWPGPVARFIERSDNCAHFAGEFGGDGSARDAEVNREMDKLRCNSLPADLQALRKRFGGDARIAARLAAFDEDGMPKDIDADH